MVCSPARLRPTSLQRRQVDSTFVKAHLIWGGERSVRPDGTNISKITSSCSVAITTSSDLTEDSNSALSLGHQPSKLG
jgi:hypothetical protein